MTGQPGGSRRSAAAPALALALASIALASALDALRAADLPAPAPMAIDLNSAGADELSLLPGVGPALAARIVEDRQARGPFRSIEDLDRVRGVGPALLRGIRPHARAGAPHASTAGRA